jgi:hypothetical protein
MKYIKLYENFLNEAENPEGMMLANDLEKAMLSNFRNVSYQMNGKNDKYYDYKNGYVGVSNRYQTDDWSWLDPKRAKILQNCNISGMYIKASVTYYEVISNASPKEAMGGIGVAGVDYINNYKSFNLSNPRKSNISKEIKDWIRFSQKQPLNDDLIRRILQFWKPSTANYKTINTRDQGIGRHASTHITKSYDKAYVIKDLNIAFGKTEEETENIIKNHFFFKKDRLDFDWKQGVMIVGGTYTEVWD